MSRIPQLYRNLMFNFEELLNHFPQRLHHFKAPLVVDEGSDFSTFLPTFVILSFFYYYYSHSSGYKVVFHCGFDLYFTTF